MTEAVLSVALLFDDAELGSHLRQALVERGVRIAHEGGLASLDADVLQRVNPDVLVVNLDDDDDDAFERLYSVIEGGRPRLVFNDAQASRALAGWDRARWARHLAVKVLAEGDIDPPRPQDARAVEVAPVVAEPAPAPTEAPVAETSELASEMEERAVAAETPAALDDAALLELPAAEAVGLLAGELTFDAPSDAAELAAHAATSDDLEAELAALLAAEAQPHAADEPSAPAEPAMPRQELPLHDGHFGEPEAMPSVADAAPEPTAPPVAAPAKPPVAPTGWSLVDHDATPPATEVRPSAAEFGIEKLSAADFLAPDVESAAADLHPTFSLELVSMEEAVAPQAWEPNEMMLDDLDAVPTRMVLLGAAVDGLDSVCAFLAALPASSRLTLLLVQHFGDKTADAVLQRLTEHSSLPVRFAQGSRARGGEVLLAPAGVKLQLRRDGSIESTAVESADAEPSIDANFSLAANSFGRDALGIVFAGRATDAVAGSQAIHDRGGKIWAESSSGEHHGDMVGALFAEHLVNYSGSPQELAAHLTEAFP